MAQVTLLANRERTCIMTVTARIHNRVTGKDFLVNVLIDSGSSVTLVSRDAVELLQLQGEAFSLKLTGITDKDSFIDSRYVDFGLESVDGYDCGPIRKAYMIPVITNDVKVFDWRPLLERQGLTGFPPAETGRIDLLIGCDKPTLLIHHEFRILSDTFVLVRTALGWSAFGSVERRIDQNGVIHYSYDKDSGLGGAYNQGVERPYEFDLRSITSAGSDVFFTAEGDGFVPDDPPTGAATDTTVSRVLPDTEDTPAADAQRESGVVEVTLEVDDGRDILDAIVKGSTLTAEETETEVNDASGDAEFLQNFTLITQARLSDTVMKVSEAGVEEAVFRVDCEPQGEVLTPEQPAKRVSPGATPAETRHLIDLIRSCNVYDKFPESRLTMEEERCSQILQESYEVKNGFAYVSPLWKIGQPSTDEPNGFTNNYAYAVARLESIHKRMTQEHFDCIDGIFEEYITKYGVLTDVTHLVNDPYNEHAIWWPHFPVINPHSDTTPVRPVLDGRAPCLGHPRISINDRCFCQGPSLMCDLCDVTLRYRKYDVVVAGDIPKMFVTVRVPDDERKFGRIIWRKRENRKELRYLEFSGHVFGKISSPACAIYASQRNARDHEPEMPRATEAVCKSTIVDDTLDSVPTEDEAFQLIVDLVKMHKPIGLNIGKFATTSLNVAKRLPDHVQKSSSMKLFELYGPKDMEYAPGTTKKLPTIRALGQFHNMITNYFCYQSYPAPDITWTKHACLSQMMKVYDPMGHLTPIMLEPKLIIQELWREKREFHETLSDDERNRWMTWLPNLPKIALVKYPRVLMPGLPEDFASVQVHVFTDASAQAFDAVAYIRVEYKDDRPVYTNFAMAKNNIAPLSPKRTIPKLELMSIELGTRLADKVRNALDIPKEDVTIWSDSKTALQWIRMDEQTLLPLVHNYSIKIKARYPITQIRWVPGTENPADVGTRPKTVEEFQQLPTWRTGPDFLVESPESWPVLQDLIPKPTDVLDGVKRDFKIFSSTFLTLHTMRRRKKRKRSPDTVIQPAVNTVITSVNFRSFARMKRVIAYIGIYLERLWSRTRARLDGHTLAYDGQHPLRQDYERLKTKALTETKRLPLYYKANKDGKLAVKYELVPAVAPEGFRPSEAQVEEAGLRWVSLHQKQYFHEEMHQVQLGKGLNLGDKLSRLGPVVTWETSLSGKPFDYQLFRLNGRLTQTEHLRRAMRQPYVLHPQDEMVKKFVQHLHVKVLKHMGGVKCLQCEINRSAWIMGSLAYLKRILRQCVECRKTHPKFMVQRMGTLPDYRVPSDLELRPAPFEVTALDVAGPWYVAYGHRSKAKRWLLIFRCAKIGAVCLEMLYGMDTDSFLKALSRFCSHFATPKRIVCDNGTNFVGADKELNCLWQNLDKDEVERFDPNIEFYWSPPHSPHFNGLVERMVGEAKKNLAFIIKPEQRISEDDLNTAFKEVQRLLNNRPMTMTEALDGRDAEPITPAHFLASGNIHRDIVTSSSDLEVKGTPLAKQYLALRRLMDQFWDRFVASMSKHLREFNKSRKWVNKRPPVLPGDMVCVLEAQPRKDQRYRMGLVTATSAGEDELSRRITIRLADGSEIVRGLNSIYVILPAEPQDPPPATERQEVRRSKRKRQRSKRLERSFFINSRED